MQIVLGVIEGQIRGDYFPDYILDPSVIDCIAQHIKSWKLIKKHMKAQDVFWKLISTIQGVSSVTLQPFQKVK